MKMSAWLFSIDRISAVPPREGPTTKMGVGGGIGHGRLRYWVISHSS